MNDPPAGIVTQDMLSALLLLLSADPLYKADPGPLAIESRPGIKLDRPGMRALSLRATYPAKGGLYPVIVCSHGMYGSEDGLAPLARFWASYGYVVLLPTHDDSLRYADAATRQKALRGSLDNVSSWRQRPRDVGLVLDSLKELGRAVPGLSGKINEKAIGMGGHSFGAWTTQVVAGMRLSALGQSLDLGDRRPKAFLVLSPSGTGGGITTDSFKTMRGPMMFVSGDNDKGRGEWDPKKHRREAFEGCPSGERWLAWLDGAYHNFGGINETPGGIRLGGALLGPANPKHVEIVKAVSLAFWDATLKGDLAARRWLDGKSVEKAGGVKLSAR